jgi:hypothetical protein
MGINQGVSISRLEKRKSGEGTLVFKAILKFQDAILSYNPRQTNKWDFSGLRFFLKKVLTFEEKATFFGQTLPFMSKLALRLPELMAKPIPLLLSSMEGSIMMSQIQVVTLL